MMPRLNAVDVLDQFVVLGRSAVAVVCPLDTNEDVLATIMVPANAMGPNGRLRVRTAWSFTNSVNQKSFKIRLGGIGGTALMACATSSAGIISLENVHDICNRGATNSQVATPAGGGTAAGQPWGFGGNGPAIGAIDTSVAQALVITGQKATGAEALTLESYLVELLQGA